MTPLQTREQEALELWKAEAAASKLLIATKANRADWPATAAVLRAMIAFADAERERCARIAEKMPGRILYFYDRPGGPPGNQYRPTTRADIAAAIRNP